MNNNNFTIRKAKPKKVFAVILGTVCFFLICFLSIAYFEHVHPGRKLGLLFDESNILKFLQLAIATVLLATLGGALLDYGRKKIAIVSGLVAALFIVGFTFLYLGWREFIIGYEMLLIVPLGAAPGLVLYNFLKRRPTHS